jgi:hypothetical protein
MQKVTDLTIHYKNNDVTYKDGIDGVTIIAAGVQSNNTLAVISKDGKEQVFLGFPISYLREKETVSVAGEDINDAIKRINDAAKKG